VGRDRRLVQWSIRDMQTVMDYGEIHNDSIMSMALTPDSKFLYTACNDGQLKQWEITKKRLWRDFGEIEKKSIKCMAVLVNQSQITTFRSHATYRTAYLDD
jgi:WD40 repeat protein